MCFYRIAMVSMQCGFDRQFKFLLDLVGVCKVRTYTIGTYNTMHAWYRYSCTEVHTSTMVQYPGTTACSMSHSQLFFPRKQKTLHHGQPSSQSRSAPGFHWELPTYKEETGVFAKFVRYSSTVVHRYAFHFWFRYVKHVFLSNCYGLNAVWIR